jgi:hypothetical protein
MMPVMKLQHHQCGARRWLAGRHHVPSDLDDAAVPGMVTSATDQYSETLAQVDHQVWYVTRDIAQR